MRAFANWVVKWFILYPFLCMWLGIIRIGEVVRGYLEKKQEK